VGKSTLFNRLTGTRDALVNDRPGVTRDRHYGTATWNSHEVVIIDTGGFEPDPASLPEGDLFHQVTAQAKIAIEEADVILFVVDRQVGLAPADLLTADILRRTVRAGEHKDRVILVVNKCDGDRHDIDAFEFSALGVEPIVCVSAEHGRNVWDLWDQIIPRLPEPVEAGPAADDEDNRILDADEPEEELVQEPGRRDRSRAERERIESEKGNPSGVPSEGAEIKIAVVGRPNIGKSTLVNRLIGEERHVVHDMPGTTVDPVDSVFSIDGQRYRLVDTAGVRRRSRIEDKVEELATLRAIKTIERCHLTILMIDGVEGVTAQDQRLAALIVERGRACIIVLNRWDLVRDLEDRNVHVVEGELQDMLPHLSWAPPLYISALTGKGCHRILPLCKDAFEQFNRRIPTAKLNDFLGKALAGYQPPQKNNNPVRIHFMSQTRVRPPSFTGWTNSPDAVGPAYRRYLEGKLRETFGFQGTPIRIDMKQKRKPGEPKA
jgi:GTP-binding protein